MSPWLYPVGAIGAGSGGPPLEVERSLRFNYLDNAFFTRNPSVSENRRLWTWSGWVKRSNVSASANQTLFSATLDASNFFMVQFRTVDDLDIQVMIGGVSSRKISTMVFRDPSAWSHIVIVCDTNNDDATKRYLMYCNGGEIIDVHTVTNPTKSDTQINSVNQHRLGQYSSTAFSGYMAEINFISGQALTPSSFGEFNATTGIWVPKTYGGTYTGQNSYYLKFADNSNITAATIGMDSSGLGNNWTPTAFSVTEGFGNDSLVDTPTDYGTDTGVGGEVRGNYATLNVLDKGSPTLQNGSLAFIAAAAGWDNVRSTIYVPASGHWWAELTPTQVISNNMSFGIDGSPIRYSPIGSTGSVNSVGWLSNGNRYVNGTITAGWAAAYTASDQVAVRIDNGSVYFYKRTGATGAWALQGGGAAATGITGDVAYAVAVYDVGNGGHLNFGQRPWAAAPPAGAKAVCTQNMPEPPIKRPLQYFDVNLRTGTNAPFSVNTLLHFAPDVVWTKGRTGTALDHSLWDTARGAQNEVYTPSTAAETVQAGGITSFDDDGFTASAGTLARINGSAATFVDWMWKKGILPGVDVVAYAGDGTAARTIAHGLGAIPQMVMVRNRTLGTQHWSVAHASLASDNNVYLTLNNPQQAIGVTTAGGPTLLTSTSSVFGVKAGVTNSNNVNASGNNYVAHIFAAVEGFSKFGGYTGSGTASGYFIWCGFRPRWVMIKQFNVAAGWVVFDSARNPDNPVGKYLIPNSTVAESDVTQLDFLSNGFKLRVAGGPSNAAGTYIYVAFAENPFKYAKAERSPPSAASFVKPAATSFLLTAAPFVATGLARTFTVQARAEGANTNNYTGTIHFTSTAGTATLPADTTLTNGVGTFSATFPADGTFTITATDTLVGTITGTTSNIVARTVTPGSQTFSTVGTHSFTVPNFITMHIDLYGAGGAGGGSANSSAGGPGGSATVGSLGLTAGGGAGGEGSVLGSNGAGGAGGSGSGGNTNLTGGAGATGILNGAAAGGAAAASGPGTGGAGGSVGGGGGGGGGGGYLRRTLSPAQISPGTNLSIVVPNGGSPGSVGGGGAAGAAGGIGRAVVTWTNT